MSTIPRGGSGTTEFLSSMIRESLKKRYRATTLRRDHDKKALNLGKFFEGWQNYKRQGRQFVTIAPSSDSTESTGMRSEGLKEKKNSKRFIVLR